MPDQKARLLPSEEQTVSTYNQVAIQWAAEHNRPGYWQAEMLRFLQLLPNGHILEIGSGGGRDAKELVALGYDYTGTDVAKRLLQVARRTLPELTFLERSVYDLDLQQKFDGFWASAVLLHIPRARIVQALKQIRQTQKLGAVGFISLKDGQGEQIEQDAFDGLVLPRHFTYWNREEFEPHLREANFEVVDYMFHPQSPRTKWHCFFVQAC